MTFDFAFNALYSIIQLGLHKICMIRNSHEAIGIIYKNTKKMHGVHLINIFSWIINRERRDMSGDIYVSSD